MSYVSTIKRKFYALLKLLSWKLSGNTLIEQKKNCYNWIQRNQFGWLGYLLDHSNFTVVLPEPVTTKHVANLYYRKLLTSQINDVLKCVNRRGDLC